MKCEKIPKVNNHIADICIALILKYFWLDKTGQELKKKKPEVTKKSILDHLIKITEEPYDPNYFKDMPIEQKMTFNRYAVVKYLSYSTYFLPYCNKINKELNTLTDEMIYKILATSLVKGKINLKKYKQKIKYTDDLVKLIANHFENSTREAKLYLDLLYKLPNGENDVIEIIKLYGKTEKEIKLLLKWRDWKMQNINTVKDVNVFRDVMPRLSGWSEDGNHSGEYLNLVKSIEHIINI